MYADMTVFEDFMESDIKVGEIIQCEPFTGAKN
jgi:tRNA-binding EMAP/Myf-like protein